MESGLGSRSGVRGGAPGRLSPPTSHTRCHECRDISDHVVSVLRGTRRRETPGLGGRQGPGARVVWHREAGLLALWIRLRAEQTATARTSGAAESTGPGRGREGGRCVDGGPGGGVAKLTALRSAEDQRPCPQVSQRPSLTHTRFIGQHALREGLLRKEDTGWASFGIVQ